MIVGRRALIIAFLVPLTAVITSCAPSPAPSPSPSAPAASANPSPSVPSPGPLDPDVTLLVTATVRAPNGAKLDLDLRVHQSTAWSDIAAETLPQAVADACPEDLTKALFASEKWSFTRANVIAVPSQDSTAEWPSSNRITLVPSAKSAPIAARGFLADDDQVTGDVASCKRDKYFSGIGTGGIAIGIPHDGVDSGQPGGFVKWTSHRFGFVVSDSDGSKATFTNCGFTLLPLGKTLGASSAGWTQANDATHCSIGAP
jgi:hypothetical protein